MKNNQLFFYILIRSWNSFKYFDTCIDSVLTQTYKNYKILFVDDASDYSKTRKSYIKKRLKNQIYILNKERKYSVYNGYYLIENFANKSNSIICVVDGDDWLIDKNALRYINNLYIKNSPVVVYGGCLVWNGKNYQDPQKVIDPHLNTRYPKPIEKANDYRKDIFRVLHIQTFKTKYFKKINKYYFQDENGSFLKYVLDLATFTSLLEISNGNYSLIKRKVYAYNTASKLTNVKVNPIEFVREALIVSKKDKYAIK